MISLAVYGAMTASTAGGAMVAIERASGWSRQLRLTPLRPAAYIAIKVLTAMVLGLLSVAVVFAAGAFTGLAFLAFFGGLLVPLTILGPTFQTIGAFTPAYGIGVIARSPLLGNGFTTGAVLNVVAWAAAFVLGATVLFRRDTQRV